MKFVVVMVLVGFALASCGAQEAVVSDDAAVEEFCAVALPSLEGVAEDDPNSARSAAVEISTAAQELAPAEGADLTAQAVTLQAAVTAGAGWSTGDIVEIVNRVCGSELVAVSAQGVVGG